MRYLTIIAVIATSALYVPVMAQDDSAPTLTTAEKIYGLSLFWKEVSYNFAFFHQVPDLDWDSAYQAFIPRVIATESTYDYYRELQRFCALLKDGHTSIGMPASARSSVSYPKLLLAEYDRRPFVRNVDTGLAAAIPIGTEVVTIDGEPATKFVRDSVLPYVSSSTEHVLWDWGIRTALSGRRGSQVQLALRRPDGTDTSVSLIREREGVQWLRENPDYPLMQFEWLADGIAYVQLNSFNDTAIVGQFESRLPDLYNSRGVIIDLRNNPGGNSDNGTAILQHFTTDTLWGSTWQTPYHIAAYKAWGKYYYQNGIESDHVAHYLGNAWFKGEDWFVVPEPGRKIEVPVAVLISRQTGSAAEDFLIFANKLEQFTYVGEPSNGSTGQPIFIDSLPGGGSARICSKRDAYRDGRDFVGYGVQPDVLVQGTVQSMIDGSDPVLDQGIEVLRGKLD